MSKTFNSFQIDTLNKNDDFKGNIKIHNDPNNSDDGLKEYKLIATGENNHWGRKYIALESSVIITENLKRDLNMMID